MEINCQTQNSFNNKHQQQLSETFYTSGHGIQEYMLKRNFMPSKSYTYQSQQNLNYYPQYAPNTYCRMYTDELSNQLNNNQNPPYIHEDIIQAQYQQQSRQNLNGLNHKLLECDKYQNSLRELQQIQSINTYHKIKQLEKKFQREKIYNLEKQSRNTFKNYRNKIQCQFDPRYIKVKKSNCQLTCQNCCRSRCKSQDKTIYITQPTYLIQQQQPVRIPINQSFTPLVIPRQSHQIFPHTPTQKFNPTINKFTQLAPQLLHSINRFQPNNNNFSTISQNIGAQNLQRYMANLSRSCSAAKRSGISLSKNHR